MNNPWTTIFAAAFALTLLGCAGAPSESASNAERQLDELIEREWRQRLAANPRLAERYGVPSEGPPLGRHSKDAIAQRAQQNLGLMDDLTKIDRAQLSRPAQVDYDVMRTILEDRVARHRHKDYLLPLTVDDGFHISLAQMPSRSEFRDIDDYRRYLARLEDVPRYLQEHTRLLESGIEAGMTLPAVVLEGYDVTIATHVVEEPEKSVFWAPFAAMPATLSAAQQSELKAEGRRQISESVVPAYRRLLTFMNERYIPSARQTTGANALPGGESYYAAMIRSFTNLELSPREIHDIGLREVARIKEEMRVIMDQVGHDDDLASFIEFLRTDPRFYATTPKELLDRAKVISKDMDGALPRLFGRLPRKPYTVEPVPDHLAPKYTGGRYVGTSADSSRPGIYWVNTYALDSRPFYTQEALSFHEAVPGHHLQGALAAEMEDLKPFRRELYLSSFGEGWGLYSEWLGKEAGFYQDPYSDFGRLTYEMWRACRLVVDTGLHAFGWTREQTMDYLASHTALSIQEVTTETDRYISWPGQALAYKLGELEIKSLRRRAEQALGEAFDVRDFHDRILRNGAVPLSVLGDEIDQYIREARSTNE